MEKLQHIERTLLIKPIEKPNKISIFNNIILFINDLDTTIEKAIPDIEEKYMDKESSNLNKINENTYLSYFEIINKNNKLTPSTSPIFEVIIYEGQAQDKNKHIGPKVVASKCINYCGLTIEDYILAEKNDVKRKIIH